VLTLPHCCSIVNYQKETLAFINDKWGSIAEYLDEIGFTFEDQRQLASVLVPRQTKVPAVPTVRTIPFHTIHTITRCVGAFNDTTLCSSSDSSWLGAACPTDGQPEEVIGADRNTTRRGEGAPGDEDQQQR
jgi:hypothetical protein